ncbi:MAG: chemotaxis protein CheW, partial [Gemmatimonadetes bacterium]|nr:chemotaxis protein CheW [Gemmatimonadota bacterium]
VLEERARLLARPEAAPPRGDELEAVTFELGGERYAIESSYLLAVVRLVRPTLLPGADPTTYGVIAWRGELLLIRDYRSLLGLPVLPRDDPGFVLVAGEDRPAFGILADAVGEFVRIPLSDVHALSGAETVGRGFVRGVTGGAVVVLDAIELWNLHG